MRKWAALGAAAVLLAAAFFLPEQLSALHDAQILDRPVVQAQDGDQEGFAETTQLPVAEKVQLMRSGSMTAMEVSREEVSGVLINISGSEEPKISSNIRDAGDVDAYEEELAERWERRLEDVKREIRSLQAAGGLPELWSGDSGISYVGYGELLYMDAEAGINFQAYRMGLQSEAYSMNVTVDVQSGRILAFSLRWEWGARPNWGLRGAANFGGVWRNYWGMDSVNSGWYNDYNRDILERSQDIVKINGDYSAIGQISFFYNELSVGIPLECWVSSGRTSRLNWNCYGYDA